MDFEEIFLGAIIGGVTDAEDILKVKSEYFSHNETRKLFDVAYKVINESGYVDFIAIQKEFGVLIGQNESKQYLDRIVGKVPEGLISSTLINDLETGYIRRATIEKLDLAKKQIQINPVNAEETVHKLYDEVCNLVKIQNEYSLSTDISNEIDSIISGKPDKIVIKTGLKAIDQTTGGIAIGEVSILGGRPSHGKTSTIICLTLSVIENNPNTKIAFFSLEMSKSQLYRKYISHISGVSSYKIRIGDLTKEEIAKIGESNAKFQKFNDRLFIYDHIYDMPTMKKMVKTIGAKLVIVDHIGFHEEVRDDKRNELGQLSKQAKRFAKTYDLGWLYVSHLSKDTERRETKRPETADLSESDQLGQNASDVYLLMYPFKYNPVPSNKNKLLMIFDKLRYGEVADRKLYFNPDLMIVRDQE